MRWCKMKEYWCDTDFLQPIQETYFGETKEITHLQECISKFRKKYITSEKYTYNPNCNKDKLIEDINRAFENTVGFEVCCFMVKTDITFNAYTYPIGSKFDANTYAKTIKTPNGYKYNKESGFCLVVCCNAGIILNPKYTDREVTGILLHEVGHNFSGSVNRRIGAFEQVNKVIIFLSSILLSILTLNPFNLILSSNGLSKWAVDKYKKDPAIKDIVVSFNHIFDIFGNFLGEINYLQTIINLPMIPLAMGSIILNTLMMKLFNFVICPALILHTFYGYADEKFADKFATEYGYGPDLHSAMEKVGPGQPNYGLTSQDWMEEHAPFVSACYGTIIFPIALIMTGLDPHPVPMERLASSIRVLKHELKDCHDPKAKKRIQGDINKLESQINEYYTLRGKVAKKGFDGNTVARLYYSVLFEGIGGDFRRHFYDNVFNNNKAFSKPMGVQ